MDANLHHGDGNLSIAHVGAGVRQRQLLIHLGAELTLQLHPSRCVNFGFLRRHTDQQFVLAKCKNVRANFRGCAWTLAAMATAAILAASHQAARHVEPAAFTMESFPPDLAAVRRGALEDAHRQPAGPASASAVAAALAAAWLCADGTGHNQGAFAITVNVEFSECFAAFFERVRLGAVTAG